MGFLIAKHILYSGKTMDQTNEILFIQEKRKEIVNPGFQRYTKKERNVIGAAVRSCLVRETIGGSCKNNEVDQ